MLFTASDLASITSHIHNWALFLLWLHPFILSGVISPLMSSSILGTYQPGEFLFQYPIILPSHTVHGVLTARILKWFAIPFSSGPHSIRPLQHDPTVLGGPTWHLLIPKYSGIMRRGTPFLGLRNPGISHYGDKYPLLSLMGIALCFVNLEF